jgi:pyruvate,water dikinase
MTAVEPGPAMPPPAVEEEFPVEFADPADASRTWERDAMHLPFAVTPLAADWATKIIGASFEPYYRQFGWNPTQAGRNWNGYTYYTFSWNVPEADEKSTEAAWIEVLRSRIPLTGDYWANEALPTLRAIYAGIEAVDVDGLPLPALADAWLDAWAATLRAWVIHFVSIMGPYQVLDDLADAYADAVGKGRDLEALALVGGGHHELEEVEAGIERLAEQAAAAGLEPALRAALATPVGDDPDDPAEPDLDPLTALPGGPDFLAAFAAFLAEHGHLGQNHDDLRQASWIENPRPLLDRIVTRIAQPSRPVAEREADLGRAAAALEAATRTALADRPDALARFDTVLAQAREIGYLTEGHNYWIDRLSQSRMRTLAVRVGRRLVREGIVDRAGDVFFLSRDEVADALRDAAPRQEQVASSRARHAHNERRVPPRYVGVVPEAKPDDPTDRFSTVRVESDEPDVLKGTGASAGIVRGPARVVLDQEGFGRIRPGDIIICPSSNPSWVPVFTIAGGLVANTGGVLSHAAVVAREFGLPAVTGTVDATTRIADGRPVEIDGTAGTVKLL